MSFIKEIRKITNSIKNKRNKEYNVKFEQEYNTFIKKNEFEIKNIIKERASRGNENVLIKDLQNLITDAHKICDWTSEDIFEKWAINNGFTISKEIDVKINDYGKAISWHKDGIFIW